MNDLTRDFFLAIKSNKVDQVKFYIRIGVDVNAVGSYIGYEVRALIFASRCGFTEIVKVLLTAGADPNSVYEGGETALMNAIQCSRNIEIVKLLLNAGANINAEDTQKRTALFYAICYPPKGRGTEIVSLLLNAGADINFKDNYGADLPLYIRIHKEANENKKIVKVLEDAMRKK